MLFTALALASSFAGTASAMAIIQRNYTWQLLAWSGAKDNTVNANMVDIDLFDQNSLIPSLKSKGQLSICYYSAGSAENWRPDVKANPTAWAAVSVGPMNGWPAEQWLDITKLSQLQPLMANRLDMAARYGCDAVEPDNTDCHVNIDCWTKIRPTITQAQAKAAQIAYNQWSASYAHSRGMLIGLKNTGDLIPNLINLFDFSINEQCVQYNECSVYKPFWNLNRPVFGIQYGLLSTAQCNAAVQQGSQMKYCASANGEECNSGTAMLNCPRAV